MKTIEEAAKGLPDNKGVLMSSILQIAEVSFKSGVEFAQRWIPVEEELPDNEDSSTYICKDESDNYKLMIGRKIKNWIYPYIKTGFIIHYRPIELK